MARLIGALRLPAPPASLALALSILSLALIASLPSAAVAKRGSRRTAVEQPASTVATPEAPAEQPAPAPAPVEGKERHHKDGRKGVHRGAATSSEEAVQETGTEAPEGQAPASAGSAQVQAQAKSQQSRKEREREREREQRRKEREARKEESKGEGHRETRKERLAREAEEARAREVPASTAPPAGAPVATAAAVTPVAAASASATTPTAANAAELPTVIGEATAHSSRGLRSARSRARRHGAAGSGTTALAPISSVSAAASSAVPGLSSKARSGVGRRPRPKRAKGQRSPLVTTVTKIIGVIPAQLWVLIGALAALALAFGVSSRLAARRARRLAAQRRELLQDVGLLQAALLPELPMRIGPVGTTAAYRPASGPAAGGDFYDVFALADGQVAVIVGDVSGHGREALPHTTLMRFTLRAYLEAGLSPRESLRTAAPVLERQLGDSFATVVLATYDTRARLLTYSCAGHPHPIITGLERSPITACSALPVGAGAVTGTRQTVVSIPGGAVACFYTDGVIEARVQGELFGTERLGRSLASLGLAPTAAGLLDQVRAEADRRPDDMAACLLGVEGAAARPLVQAEELQLSTRELEHDRVRRFLLAAGVQEHEIDAALISAGELLARTGGALLKVRLDTPKPIVTLTQDNVASLSARAIARTQEVAL